MIYEHWTHSITSRGPQVLSTQGFGAAAQKWATSRASGHSKRPGKHPTCCIWTKIHSLSVRCIAQDRLLFGFYRQVSCSEETIHSMSDNIEQMVFSSTFWPFRPIQRVLLLCANKFLLKPDCLIALQPQHPCGRAPTRTLSTMHIELF